MKAVSVKIASLWLAARQLDKARVRHCPSQPPKLW